VSWQLGCDAVQQAVQAEVEALVPGLRVVRVDAGFQQVRDPRVGPDGLEPLPVALALGLDLIRRQADGLTTRVVRALDAAGVQVNDVTIQRASLDDVFLALTGHASGTDEQTEGSEAA
jgi:hypothetical protein